jgi:oxygen-independent coproporphyrinogen III oxidase
MSGIYIHIPFCKQKCTYCDFHFSTNYKKYYEEMISCLQTELVIRKEEFADELIESVYFGGGTPSLLTKASLKAIISSIKTNYVLAKNLEFTLECNPDDISEESLLTWRELGVNRLSIGVQSFEDRDLKWMNRAHNAKQSSNSIILAQELGFTNISIDLLYGQPKMSLKRWEKQIDMALGLNIQHISAYCLTVEEKTALHHLVNKKELVVATNELQHQQFLVLQDKLAQHKFIQYEISNFGLADFFSKHNSAYWLGKKYLGIGPSAHSFDGTNRFWNVANNTKYMQALSNQEIPQTIEVLTKQNRFNEAILLGLRTIWGVSIKSLDEILPRDTKFEQIKNKYIAQELLLEQDNYLFLTKKGLHFADLIAMDLFQLD